MEMFRITSEKCAFQSKRFDFQIDLNELLLKCYKLDIFRIIPEKN